MLIAHLTMDDIFVMRSKIKNNWFLGLLMFSPASRSCSTVDFCAQPLRSDLTVVCLLTNRAAIISCSCSLFCLFVLSMRNPRRAFSRRGGQAVSPQKCVSGRHGLLPGVGLGRERTERVAQRPGLFIYRAYSWQVTFIKGTYSRRQIDGPIPLFKRIVALFACCRLVLCCMHAYIPSVA